MGIFVGVHCCRFVYLAWLIPLRCGVRGVVVFFEVYRLRYLLCDRLA